LRALFLLLLLANLLFVAWARWVAPPATTVGRATPVSADPQAIRLLREAPLARELASDATTPAAADNRSLVCVSAGPYVDRASAEQAAARLSRLGFASRIRPAREEIRVGQWVRLENLATPEEAFSLSFIPNDGVGLARMEFIVTTYIKIHPLALVHFDQLSDAAAKAEIARMTAGYDDRPQFFVDQLAQGVGMLAAAFYPKDVILRLSDFKTNEYANLIGGSAFEPHEDNPMIGFRGASRYYHPRYQAGFALECRAVATVREEMGLTNLKLMIPFCRTVEEGRRVQAEMATHGLRRGDNGLEIYVMCEIPSNVVLAEEFADIFDGFSIGSNDLTQLILGVDRDSAIVAPIFDERNPAVTRMIAQVIATCRAKGRKIGICGQAPSDYPEFAQFLVEQGIDSISLNPDTMLKTTLAILETEASLKEHPTTLPAASKS